MVVGSGGVTREVERLRAQLQALAHAMRVFAEATAAPNTLLETVAQQAAEAAHALCLFSIMSSDGQWLEPAAIFDAGGGDVSEVVKRLRSGDHPRVDWPHPLPRPLPTGA